MPSYFKPWRRKLGVLTLAMACVFAAGWVRSHAVSDRISIQIDDLGYCFFASSQGYVSWRRTYGGPHDFPVKRIAWQTFADHKGVWQPAGDLGDAKVAWRWQAFGFDFGKCGFHSVASYFTYNFAFVPYWSIVIPLTVLSGYLLLSKPRQSTL